ncbi:MAG: YbfB/YjiJ family MFS transporter [Actinomycetes bacterium]
MASLLLSVGVARFSYTPLLPLMQEQAGLGVFAAGALAAVNYSGYLAGALVAVLVSDVTLKYRLYRLGMVVSVLSTVVMALDTSDVLWGVSRFVAGLGSAAGMLLGTGLILQWLIRHDHRSELGIHFAGIGLGIAGCAVLVELASPWLDWRGQWYAFTAVGAVLLVPALRWVPRPEPGGHTRSGVEMVDRPPGVMFVRTFVAAYFCAGVAYVIGATFIVTIVDHLPGLDGRGNLAFLVIGLGAAPASIVWDLIARRTGDLGALALAAVVQMIGLLLPVVVGGTVWTLLGALLFGATCVGMVSLVLTMAGRFYPTRPARMMGTMTLSYGVAQILGPIVTGALATRYDGYAVGLYVAAGALLVGAVLLLSLMRTERRTGRRTTGAAGSAAG